MMHEKNPKTGGGLILGKRKPGASHAFPPHGYGGCPSLRNKNKVEQSSYTTHPR